MQPRVSAMEKRMREGAIGAFNDVFFPRGEMGVRHPTIARSHYRSHGRLLSYLQPCRAYLPDGVGTVINKAVPLLALPPLHFGGEVSSRRPCGVLHRLISGRGFERSRFSPFIKWTNTICDYWSHASIGIHLTSMQARCEAAHMQLPVVRLPI